MNTRILEEAAARATEDLSRPDLTEEDRDAVSRAWEFFTEGGISWALAKWHARREIRWTQRGRMFPESARSITSNRRSWMTKLARGPKRRDFDVRWNIDQSPSPAALAADRLDVEEWCDHLSVRQKRIVARLAEGLDPQTIAKELVVRFQVVYIEIYKLRRSWRHFAGLPQERAALTSRERSVLELLTRGVETSAIAQQLHMSPCDVRMTKSIAMRKLGAFTPEAVALKLTEVPPE